VNTRRNNHSTAGRRIFLLDRKIGSGRFWLSTKGYSHGDGYFDETLTWALSGKHSTDYKIVTSHIRGVLRGYWWPLTSSRTIEPSARGVI
jgi:hypothetical protein